VQVCAVPAGEGIIDRRREVGETVGAGCGEDPAWSRPQAQSATVEAAIATITHGVAASGSVMVVCPGAAAAIERLQGRRDVPVGVHLTLIADFPGVPWAPLTMGTSIQEDGRLLGPEHRVRLLAQADANEVEAEFRAQIEVLLAADLRPTHLDWHSLMDGGRDDIFDLTLGLAQEYRLDLRAWTERGRAALRSLGFAAQNQPFVDTFAISLEGKHDALIDRLRRLPDGLSEWAVHPAQAACWDGGANVRRTDYDLLMADETRQVLAEEGISVLGYGDRKLGPPADR